MVISFIAKSYFMLKNPGKKFRRKAIIKFQSKLLAVWELAFTVKQCPKLCGGKNLLCGTKGE